jgi:hypothetical protein
MLTNALVNNIAFKTLTIMGFIPIWIGSVLPLQAGFQQRDLEMRPFAGHPAMIWDFSSASCFQQRSPPSHSGRRASIPSTNSIMR